MSEDIYSMTKSGFHEALRQARETAWDEGYEEGFWDGRAEASSEPAFLGSRKRPGNPYGSQP